LRLAGQQQTLFAVVEQQPRRMVMVELLVVGLSLVALVALVALVGLDMVVVVVVVDIVVVVVDIVVVVVDIVVVVVDIAVVAVAHLAAVSSSLAVVVHRVPRSPILIGCSSLRSLVAVLLFYYWTNVQHKVPRQ
jgi:hypothetical protein